MKSRIHQELEQQFAKNHTYASGRILGSMCTQPHPAAVKAFNQFIETNLGDTELFPGTCELEQRVIYLLGKLLAAPPESGGCITSGGTESNLTALWIYTSRTGKRSVIIPEHAHFSFAKAASLMNLEVQWLPLRNHIADVQQLNDLINDDTACAVGVAGTTSLGLIDPIAEMGAICNAKDLPLHVDAAFGGFVIPFLSSNRSADNAFNFSVPGVSSIAIDPHKMGLSVIPAGTLLLRDRRWWQYIEVESVCTHTKRQHTLLGTRPGAAAAATYAAIKEIGWDGYRKIVTECMEITKYAQKKLTEAGYELIVKPKLNLLAVRVVNPRDIANRLSEKNWKVGVDEERGCIRIVCMPHVKKTLIDNFICDLQSVTA
jgi:tyrosine decarboxylase/aspartate 1-decarboxylase